ncbi:MAG: DUF4136 domain-containing protein [Cytophagaceae bacterium]
MKNCVLMIIMLVFLGACATTTPSAYHSYDTAADFTKYRTFAWITAEKEDCPEPADKTLYDNPLIEKHIKQRVSQRLREKGMRLDRDNPQVLINYDIIVENKERIVNIPIIANQPNFAIYNPNIVSPTTPYFMYNYLRNDFTVYPYHFHYSGVNIYNTTPGGMYYGYNIMGPYVIGSHFEKMNFKEGTLVIDVIDRETNSLIWRGWSNEVLHNPAEFEVFLPAQIDQILARYPIPTLGN